MFYKLLVNPVLCQLFLGEVISLLFYCWVNKSITATHILFEHSLIELHLIKPRDSFKEFSEGLDVIKLNESTLWIWFSNRERPMKNSH